MNTPLGKKLIHQITDISEAKKLLRQGTPRIEINPAKAIEVFNIGYGIYSPLKGFSCKNDFYSVLSKLRLTNGIFWPIPIILDINKSQTANLINGRKVILTRKAKPVGILCVKEIYPFDKEKFCKKVFGTTDKKHPGVRNILAMKNYLIGGSVSAIKGKTRIFRQYNKTPEEVRAFFKLKGWKNIVGFHTRNVPHRGHEHIQREGLKSADGLFINPLVGYKKVGDFTNEIVLKAYEVMVKKIMPKGKTMLGILNYSPYYAGPREALLTAVIRKNFGCTHFIIGRDHTGVGKFYAPSDYEKMLSAHEKNMGIKILHFTNAFYCKDCGDTSFSHTCVHDESRRIHPSGTKIRNFLVHKQKVPAEMMRPEIADLLLKHKKLFV